jgi:hypothetical protein
VINDAFRQAGRDDVVKWEVLRIKNGDRLRMKFEAKNSKWRQGVWLKTDKGIEVSDHQFGSVELWTDTAPDEVEIKFRTADGLLHLYNIWDKGGGRESQSYTSGMLVEEIPNGRRYRCNDIGFATQFDKLIFTVEFLSPA